MNREGTIIRAVSGFYYVRCEDAVLECRAKGRFRKEGITPLVGDRVLVEDGGNGTGTVSEVLPRKNAFSRPAVANVDYLVMLLSAALPVTDPFLADRVTVRCEKNHCGVMLVINKCDLEPGNDLYEIYMNTGYPLFRVSAATGEGIEALKAALGGKICCFTGNSGVGKSSLINTIAPDFHIPTGAVSEKLGRGRHTTRHVELFDLGGGTLLCDTPGFASFGDETEEPITTEELPLLFPEFNMLQGSCRFDDCTHRAEPGCAVREAVEAGQIHRSRYSSYLRLYEESARIKPWELESKRSAHKGTKNVSHP
ncbi:MAG: ribosome small subunit-dependent GTPase A [Oscillospiraceae bacterium]|nr:ribosome small subunit-dependent GTPase A [Oscillospiraceae bacterium]